MKKIILQVVGTVIPTLVLLVQADELNLRAGVTEISKRSTAFIC